MGEGQLNGQGMWQRVDELRRMTAQGLQEARQPLPAVFERIHEGLEELAAIQALPKHCGTAQGLRYADLFEQAPEAYLVTNLGGIILLANRAAAALLGQAPELLAGRSLLTFVVPDDRDGLRELCHARPHDARLRHGGARLDRPGGAKPMLVSASVSAEGTEPHVRWLLREMVEWGGDLERQVVDMTEHVRQRIGRDLHDALGPYLTGISLLAKALEQRLLVHGSAQAEASEAQSLAALAGEAIRQARSLAKGLCPVEDKPEGLMLALSELAAGTERMFGTSCVFLCNGPVLLADSAAATHLHHIAQEAVNNAMRHGQAKRIVVRLESDGDLVCLTVEDDGCGLPTGWHDRGGMGLRIMQYRAAAIAGTLKIENCPGQGVRVTCTMRRPL